MQFKFVDFFSIQFIKFIGVSGSTAVINLLLRYLLNRSFNYETSIILAYIFSTTLAFVLNKRLVFEKTERQINKQMQGFISVNIIGMVQTLIISVCLKKYFFPLIGLDFYAPEIAHFIGLGSTAFTSYFGHKAISFRK